jgi:pimeloyl-ACP methyl ester carboxylesterase
LIAIDRSDPAQPLGQERSGRFAQVNGLAFEFFEAGTGAPAILLHGFPDHAGAWSNLARRLGASVRSLALNQRGYGRSFRPAEIDDYRLDHLVGDVSGFLDALTLDRVHLCGHDWGGVVGFAFAARYRERLASLTAINAPPLSVLQNMIRIDPEQRAASQYIQFLRSSAADEIFYEANVDVLLDRFLGKSRAAGLVDDDEVRAYRDAWTQPGVWQAMLAWYRAASLELSSDASSASRSWVQTEAIACPVLLIWGEADQVFIPAMADAIALSCMNIQVEGLPGAGHMPHRDLPDRCAALMLDFWSRHPVDHA